MISRTVCMKHCMTSVTSCRTSWLFDTSSTCSHQPLHIMTPCCLTQAVHVHVNLCTSWLLAVWHKQYMFTSTFAHHDSLPFDTSGTCSHQPLHIMTPCCLTQAVHVHINLCTSWLLADCHKQYMFTSTFAYHGSLLFLDKKYMFTSAFCTSWFLAVFIQEVHVHVNLLHIMASWIFKTRSMCSHHQTKNIKEVGIRPAVTHGLCFIHLIPQITTQQGI